MQEFKIRCCGSDIIGVVETFASDTINDAEISLDGSTCIVLIGKVSLDLAGLALYVNSKLKSSLCNDLMKSDFSESLWCTINIMSLSASSWLQGASAELYTSSGLLKTSSPSTTNSSLSASWNELWRTPEKNLNSSVLFSSTLKKLLSSTPRH